MRRRRVGSIFICGKQGSKSDNTVTDEDELEGDACVTEECDGVVGFFQ